MHTRRFRILTLVLALSMVFLAGCTAKPTGGTGTPIKIGGIGPLTGGAAVYGSSVANGAKIALEEVNALGGLQFD